MSRIATSGFLLGKFLPPHRGHQYLIEFASAYVDRLTVLACSIASEPIPGELRFRWMCESFSGVHVIHHTDGLPQTPEEDPEFWALWRQSIRRRVPDPIDYVFASEPYGARLAEELGAEFVPVDLERRNVPVSGRAIRADPLGHWRDLLAAVRPYYLKRACVVDFARSSLADELAAAFDTPCLHAYGGGLDTVLGAGFDVADAVRLSRGQTAARSALERQANRIVICQLDALTISLLTLIRRGTCPPEIEAASAQQRFDLYIVNDCADADAQTGQQVSGRFLDLLLAACADHPVHVAALSGAGHDRFVQARSAVSDLLRNTSRS